MVNTPISADFSATPLSGTKPLIVHFTNGSTGNPNSWKWYFGDGNTSTLENPQHTYNADGKYTVKLVSKSNTSEDSITKIDFITVGNVGFEDIDIEQHLKIYPNPISNNSTLTIDYDQVQIEDVELMNIVGKKMFVEIEHSSGRINIGISNLSSGIYILKLSSKAGDTLMRKIIIR
jgi:PKD repeat protein